MQQRMATRPGALLVRYQMGFAGGEWRPGANQAAAIVSPGRAP